MNKQFLSLLLLTSFVGTMSPTITSGKALSLAVIDYFKSDAARAAEKLAAEAARAAEKLAAEAARLAAETTAQLVVAKNLGYISVDAMEKGILAIQTETARLAARPFYTKAWEGTCGYASSAKTSVANGAQAVVASAKSHPYIATGVVAACGLACLGYKFWNRDSMSLTEQGKTSLRNALVKANELGTEGFHNPSVATPLKSCEFFTIKDNELPKIVIDALNNHIMILRKLVEINQVKQTSKLSDSDLAIETNWKTRSKQVLAELTAASAE